MKFELQNQRLAGPLGNLDQRRALFAELPLDPTHAHWLKKRAWVRTIHGTTRIEGNTLSDVEVEGLLAGVAASSASQREAREIIGVREALALVDELAVRAVPIDEGVIREIHRRVLWGQSPLLTPGEYRRGENRVVDSAGQPVFSTPSSGDVPELMRALSTWLGSAAAGHAAPVAAALAHLEFVAIHPFNDGNGRCARALSRLLLGRGDFAFDGLVALDAQFDLDRTAYFAAIRESTGPTYAPGYDATAFVLYFLESSVKAADHVLARIRGLGTVLTEVRRSIADRSLPAPMIDGLAFAWLNRHIRPADYIGFTGRSPQSTTRDLARAVEAGWLVPVGEKRGRYYVLGPRLLDVPASGEIP